MKDRIYQDARRKVKSKKAFFVHLAVYLSVGLFFFLINMATFEGEYWFFFPLLPWGVAVSIQYLVTFGFPGSGALSQEWEEREFQKELFKRGYAPEEHLKLPNGETEEAQEERLDLKEPVKVKEKIWDENELV